MVVAEDPQTAALLAHVVSQVETNIQFLASRGYISQMDASTILNKLPAARTEDHPISSANEKMQHGNIANPALWQKITPPPTLTPVAHPAGTQARAVWSYNENNKDPGDLSFKEGDIIEIIEKTNADWWMGRLNGREGLFPSNYVEETQTKEKAVYRPFGATYHGTGAPPAGDTMNSTGLQQGSGHEGKKEKLSSLKNTMAHSAAGGVGFGAGAAIGGGLVRAIF